MKMTEIVKLRKKMGLTQKDLAKMLGFDTWTVNRWETGRTVPYPRGQEALERFHRKYYRKYFRKKRVPAESWNYRIVHSPTGFAVHEAFYKKGELDSISRKPSAAVCRSRKELKLMAVRIQAAMTEGTIEYDAVKRTAGKGKVVYWERSTGTE